MISSKISFVLLQHYCKIFLRARFLSKKNSFLTVLIFNGSLVFGGDLLERSLASFAMAFVWGSRSASVACVMENILSVAPDSCQQRMLKRLCHGIVACGSAEAYKTLLRNKIWDESDKENYVFAQNMIMTATLFFYGSYALMYWATVDTSYSTIKKDAQNCVDDTLVWFYKRADFADPQKNIENMLSGIDKKWITQDAKNRLIVSAQDVYQQNRYFFVAQPHMFYFPRTDNYTQEQRDWLKNVCRVQALNDLFPVGVKNKIGHFLIY